jgi:hypothetical protein
MRLALSITARLQRIGLSAAVAAATAVFHVLLMILRGCLRKVFMRFDVYNIAV